MPTWFPLESLQSAALKSGAILSLTVYRGDIMKMLFSLVVAAAILASAAQAQVTKESVPGITNLARVETTVAGAGAAGLGLSNATLKNFMLTYIESHKK